ncbi:MAG TPA: primosomal protein N' [Patescibacteria group bacterium]|nr:primosomal protein N' [Patescibacteria group bacterium]
MVPKSRTQKEAVFDYAISPKDLPFIRPGILVEIPFHGRKVEGMVINLKRKSDLSQIKLKTIQAVIDPVPVADQNHLKFAQWISDYYLEPLGKTLFENIVPPAKRIIKVQSDIPKDFPAPQQTKSIKRGALLNQYLLIADFPKRLAFYLEAIKKTLRQNRGVIIIIPDLSLLKFFPIKMLQKDYGKETISLIHSRLSKTLRWLEFQRIRQGKAKIVIGSTSALFVPVQNLGLIIIDQEENDTYKNQRSPRFHASKAAEKLAKLLGANLVLGSITPRVETYYQALKGKYRIIRRPLTQKPLISIINMNSERRAISLSLEKAVEQALQLKKRTLLVLNRKGEGSKLACSDCGWVWRCPRCQLPLIPQKEQIICFRCQKKFSLPERCPRCRGVGLRPYGLGTGKLEKFIQDIFPQSRIIRLEDTSILKFSDSLFRPWDIAITTTFGLKFHFPAVYLVALIDADQGLNWPDFRTQEKNFAIFYKFLKVGERGIIQTHFPENPLISALSGLDFERFFLNEIALRRKYQFPPFVQLIRLLLQNKDEQTSRKKAQEIFQKLQQIKSKNHLLLGPSAPFFQKKRGSFLQQIMIKILPAQNRQNDDILKEFLRVLPKDWQIDVEPMDLL